MFGPFLFVHSWMRWIVLVALLYFVARTTYGWAKQIKWTERDSHFVWIFNQIFGYQVLFGLTLWLAMSPIVKAGFKEPSTFINEPLIFFWGLRHGLTMIVALGLFQIGAARAKRSPTSTRMRTYSLTSITVLFFILSAIPWPWMSYGRDLFRWFL
ncbi:MAG: hypothetical protein EOP05_16950 [Proteobacteria bacterium]|nr:MAG: hypothetical protein EOP05_16950 [Pseudomonadota bacterium]